ncbi:polysaccharide deacetylase family protein [Brevibacillus fluminis]|uniref:polysaccharide deacetylase family protein n=1 Tax=Brevibacillus fluminis TaxID=511487 RepID=UPI0016068CE2|nr:polysaccharide deacetylase family protein [Brevibacillus fluminis]
MLHIYHPPTYQPERQYIFDVLFAQFLGLEYETMVEQRDDIRICLADDCSGKSIVLADVLFQQPQENWLQQTSLPKQPLETCDALLIPLSFPLISRHLPVLYGKRLNNGLFFEQNQLTIHLGIDIFGSSFFMLTRYEEVVKTERDKRGRFQASASLASQEGFLDRPIVNEYVELLWACIHFLWPGSSRKKREFRIVPSHDVDSPLGVALSTPGQVLRNMAGDVLMRKSVELAVRRMRSLVLVRQGRVDADLHNTFHWIMTQSERIGLRSSFYFIADHPAGRIDGVYELDSPWIKRLLREIHQRGHEIGLHPSYSTYRDPAQLQRELARLHATLEQIGIDQPVSGGRQHYLRWEAPTTWQLWEDAGLVYDSTLSFADRAGFRCGTCYEYTVFNVKTRRPLRLRERPLIAMEGSLLDIQYMHLTREEARHELELLKERCRLFQGDFTLLWHNCTLIHFHDAKLYQSAIGGGNK